MFQSFAISDRTPPYIDTFISNYFHTWEIMEKRSPIRMSLRTIVLILILIRIRILSVSIIIIIIIIIIILRRML